MSAPTASTSMYGGAFWERLWRSAGIQSTACFIVAGLLMGHLPQIGAPADVLTAFYAGERTRILIAAVFFGLATLNLLWFAAAVRATLAAEGKDGWGAAEIAAGAAFGALFLATIAIVVTLAYTIAGSGDGALPAALNDFAWVCFVLTSFPRAMLIMAGSFGFWRAGLISNAIFAVCVGAVVLVLLGGTTWLRAGIWAPDGLYSCVISPVIGLVWVVLASAFLTRRPAAGTGW